MPRGSYQRSRSTEGMHHAVKPPKAFQFSPNKARLSQRESAAKIGGIPFEKHQFHHSIVGIFAINQGGLRSRAGQALIKQGQGQLNRLTHQVGKRRR